MSYDPKDGDVQKLLELLKKILKNHPEGSEQFSKLLDQKGFNLNLCFLTFVPMSPDDLDELEDMYEEFLHQTDGLLHKRDSSKIEFKLNLDDINFLKKHGIRF